MQAVLLQDDKPCEEKKKKNLDTPEESLPSVKHVRETSQYHPASSQSGIWAKMHEET